MGALLGLVGFLLFFVYLIWFIIRTIRKKPKKQPAIGMLVCFILFVAGVALSPSAGKEDKVTSDKLDVATVQSEKNSIKDDDSKSGTLEESVQSDLNKSEDDKSTAQDTLNEVGDPVNLESVEKAISDALPQYQSSKWFDVDCEAEIDESISVILQVDLGSNDLDAALSLAAQCYKIAEDATNSADLELDSVSVIVVNNGAPVGLFSTNDGENFVSISDGKRTEISLP